MSIAASSIWPKINRTSEGHLHFSLMASLRNREFNFFLLLSLVKPSLHGTIHLHICIHGIYSDSLLSLQSLLSAYIHRSQFSVDCVCLCSCQNRQFYGEIGGKTAASCHVTYTRVRFLSNLKGWWFYFFNKYPYMVTQLIITICHLTIFFSVLGLERCNSTW